YRSIVNLPRTVVGAAARPDLSSNSPAARKAAFFRQGPERPTRTAPHPDPQTGPARAGRPGSAGEPRRKRVSRDGGRKGNATGPAPGRRVPRHRQENNSPQLREIPALWRNL